MIENLENKSFLIILCGIPSAGKSEIAFKTAKVLENRFKKPTLVVDTDKFREMMPISQVTFKPEREALMRRAAFNTIALGLQEGYIVISDDLNYYVSMRKDLSALAKNRGAGFGVVYINTPLNIALEWNKKRKRSVSQELIEEINSKFEEPGRKYKWDTPIVTVDPSKESLQTISDLISEKTIQAMKVWGKPITRSPEAPTQIRDLEKATRRAMGEIMQRFRRTDLVDELSELRRRSVKESLKEGWLPEAAVKFFIDNAEKIFAKAIIKPENNTFVHVGLLGHVDHGKTALARCLTEKASTASLDKSPEARRRSMTIDIGFSSFMLKEYIVNLVDLPGHSTLIKHVTAGANIIDVGLLTVAADEGPKIQTLEHLRILENLEIKQIIVIITKIDLVTEKRIKDVQTIIQEMLEGTRFENARMIAVSALTKAGIKDLKTALYEILTPPIRNWTGPFRMPVDHAFHIKGIGTVLTGTVLRGSIRLGSAVELQPTGKRENVRSIEVFGTTTKEVKAGDRVGIAVSNLRPSEASRGYELCSPGTLNPASLLIVKMEVDKNFGYVIKRGDTIHVNIGLQNVTALFTPFHREKDDTTDEEVNVVLNGLKVGDKAMALLKTTKEVTTDVGDKLLLMKLDFSPRKSRIIGVSSLLNKLKSEPEFVTKKTRQGIVVKNYRTNTFVVEGLFKNKKAAEHFLGTTIKSKSGVLGKISSAYGDEGAVLIETNRNIDHGERVQLIRYRGVKT